MDFFGGELKGRRRFFILDDKCLKEGTKQFFIVIASLKSFSNLIFCF